MKLKSIIAIALFVSCISANAQKFSQPLHGFSKKKTTYITKTDGTEIKCNVKNFKWKKGLIDELKIVGLDGKKIKIKPEEISFMYLAPSRMAKLGSSLHFLTDATKWDRTDLNQDIISKGYIYHERSLVKIKKKTGSYILQLLNPSFSNVIKVYFDPFAKETMSLGVGGIDVVGGLAKSYYIKIGEDKAAYKLKKNMYQEEFFIIFKDCPQLIEKYKGNVKWADFETHV